MQNIDYFSDLPDIFSPAYMAQILNISPANAYRISSKDGLSRKIGDRRLVIHKNDFLIWFESKKNQPEQNNKQKICSSQKCNPIQRR